MSVVVVTAANRKERVDSLPEHSLPGEPVSSPGSGNKPISVSKTSGQPPMSSLPPAGFGGNLPPPDGGVLPSGRINDGYSCPELDPQQRQRNKQGSLIPPITTGTSSRRQSAPQTTELASDYARRRYSQRNERSEHPDGVHGESTDPSSRPRHSAAGLTSSSTRSTGKIIPIE